MPHTDKQAQIRLNISSSVLVLPKGGPSLQDAHYPKIFAGHCTQTNEHTDTRLLPIVGSNSQLMQVLRKMKTFTVCSTLTCTQAQYVLTYNRSTSVHVLPKDGPS